MVGDRLCESAKEISADMKANPYTVETATEFPNATAELLQVRGLLTVGMLKPVDLTIQAGQLWMLSGISGTGKSQLLKAIADLIPHSGQAWLNGVAQNAISPETWRGQVMYFAAETAWWLETIAGHFAEDPSPQQLEALGLDQSILQKHPDSCSSGEKQRLALLRGLALKPKVLLLDEITANLDPESTLKVEAFLQQYIQTYQSLSERTSLPVLPNEGATRAILWISHDVHQRQRLTRPELQLVLNK